MRTILLILFAAIQLTANAQDFTLPDSLAVAKNKIRRARIYSTTPQGVRTQSKELTYDQWGRIVKETAPAGGYYYEYTYDHLGRKKSSTYRAQDGSLAQRSTHEYDDVNYTRTTRNFFSSDTVNPEIVYVYNSKNERIQEKQYRGTELRFTRTIAYGDSGVIISAYDSSSVARVATWRDEHNNITRRRTYDPQGGFLHEYRYTYDYFGRTWKMTDSTGVNGKITYEAVYSKEGGPREGIMRNGVMMSDAEEKQLIYEHLQFVPQVLSGEPELVLPLPESVTTHEIIRDKRNNIVKDIVTVKEGNFSQTYEYIYEYEYF
jgi:YD repeat-containing protein